MGLELPAPARAQLVAFRAPAREVEPSIQSDAVRIRSR